MSGGKGAKRTNSGSAGKKTTFSDQTNHAAVSLLPKTEDSSRWVSTLAPLTLLKAASKHAAKLNENRMLYNVSDATKAQIKGYYLTQIEGQTLDILWDFSFVKNFYHRNFWILSTAEIQPHDGFITQWVFPFLPLQPSRILSMDSHLATGRDYGSPHIVGFFFFTTNHTNLNGSTRWGSPFRPPPWAQSLILTVHGLGLFPQDIPTGPNLYL